MPQENTCAAERHAQAQRGCDRLCCLKDKQSEVLWPPPLDNRISGSYGSVNLQIFGRASFFQVPTVGFRTSGFRYNIGPYLGYVIRVFRKIAYIQKFREKKLARFVHAAGWGAPLCKTPMIKRYPYHFTIGFSGLP
eukprot:SAG11_NODE_73_length_18072_cov_8.670005_11_plen_136_part_00